MILLRLKLWKKFVLKVVNYVISLYILKGIQLNLHLKTGYYENTSYYFMNEVNNLNLII